MKRDLGSLWWNHTSPHFKALATRGSILLYVGLDEKSAPIYVGQMMEKLFLKWIVRICVFPISSLFLVVVSCKPLTLIRARSVVNEDC